MIFPSQLNDNFLNLTDTPNTFVGNGGKGVVVNSGATALEFSSVASYSSSPADIPPIIPSIYDDEFSGTSLNPKWGWYYNGAPLSVNVNNGKMFLTFNDVATNFQYVNVIAQPAPNQSFTILAKMSSSQIHYVFCGLFMGDSSFGAESPILIGMGYNSTVMACPMYRSGSSWIILNTTIPLSPNNLYFKATWNKATAKFRGWASPDGLVWLPITNGTTHDNNLTTINYFGMAFLSAFYYGSRVTSMGLSVDYFRVTL